MDNKKIDIGNNEHKLLINEAMELYLKDTGNFLRTEALKIYYNADDYLVRLEALRCLKEFRII